MARASFLSLSLSLSLPLSLFTSRKARDRFEFEQTRASAYGRPVFERGDNAGDLPRKFISFHCLEKESDELKISNTEGTENFPELPRKRESETVFIGKAEISPAKSLAVLQVAAAKDSTVRKSEDTNLKVLELLDESLVDRGSAGSNVVPVGKETPRCRLEHILRSELKEKRIGSVSKRPLCDMDADVADGQHSKSVAFQHDDESGRLYSAGCELVGESNTGQLFPSSSRPDGTHYGTSELESIAQRRVGDLSETRVPHKAGGVALLCSSGITVQHGVGIGRSKYYPSDSARTLLKVCFIENLPVQLNPHEHFTAMNSDQIIQCAKAFGLELSFATCGMLEDVLLKIGGRTGKRAGDKGSGYLLCSVGQDPQLLRVLLLDHFLPYLLLQYHLVMILPQVILQSKHVLAGRLMQH